MESVLLLTAKGAKGKGKGEERAIHPCLCFQVAQYALAVRFVVRELWLYSVVIVAASVPASLPTTSLQSLVCVTRLQRLDKRPA
ncbi:hypothetical protein H6F86_16275 [Phormidium sp. FACHB-592]|uniref:Uncharacterized protein n=1 Tax=Stenomitos frigidus AS-A4 TaxID=2933935 RepID=A0ABV0KQ35_9CYAN|nr:hypothetical protein [Phormidium sp. FACHB-592]MBD2075421.1 hypothetical protein [Phormidium sp. FACHB-592]